MSHKYVITGSVIELNNPYGSESVTIRNKRYDDKIIFDEKVQFNGSVEPTSLKIGSYELIVDGNDNLVVQKNGNTIFTFSE